MKKFLAFVLIGVAVSVGAASADGVPPYSWKLLTNDDGDVIAVRFRPEVTGSVITANPRRGERCTSGIERRNDSWPNFLATLKRDTSNNVYVQVTACSGENSRVCVDIEDKREGETSFNPHICATLRVVY